MRRFVIGIALVFLALSPVFGQGAKTELTWLFWYPEPKEVIAAYKKVNPNVNIVYEQVGGNNYAKVLNTRVLANELPDLYVPYYLETYDQQISAGALVDLTSEPFVKTIDESAVALNSRNNRLYAFPLESTVICTFYNKELFKKYNVKVPTNYDEFLKASETFKKNGVVALVQGMADLWQGKYAGGFNQLSTVLYNDADWLDKLNKREVKWTDPIMLKQYQKKESYFKAGYQHPDSLSMNFDQAWKVFCTGGAAMIGGGTFALNNVFGTMKPQFDWDLTYTFVNDAGQPQKTEYFASNSLLCINAKSKDVKASIKFLEWLASPEGQRIWSVSNRTFSASKAVDFSFHPDAAKFKPLYDNPQKFQFIREPAYLATEFGKTIQDLFMGSKSAKQVVEELQKKTDDSLPR